MCVYTWVPWYTAPLLSSHGSIGVLLFAQLSSSLRTTIRRVGGIRVKKEERMNAKRKREKKKRAREKSLYI